MPRGRRRCLAVPSPPPSRFKFHPQCHLPRWDVLFLLPPPPLSSFLLSSFLLSSSFLPLILSISFSSSSSSSVLLTTPQQSLHVLNLLLLSHQEPLVPTPTLLSDHHPHSYRSYTPPPFTLPSRWRVQHSSVRQLGKTRCARSSSKTRQQQQQQQQQHGVPIPIPRTGRRV